MFIVHITWPPHFRNFTPREFVWCYLDLNAHHIQPLCPKSSCVYS